LNGLISDKENPLDDDGETPTISNIHLGFHAHQHTRPLTPLLQLMTEGNTLPSGLTHERRITFTSVAVTCMIACMMAIAHWTPRHSSINRDQINPLRGPRKILSVLLDEFSEVDLHASQLRTTDTHTQRESNDSSALTN